MQNRVFVLDANEEPLMPTHPARARQLLDAGRAVVYRYEPFTILLKDRTVAESEVQETQVKVDPGSKTTGFAVVTDGKRGKRVVWAAELKHRGDQIRRKMRKRRQWRCSRRPRKTRYRPRRFNNRRRRKGWLPPSVQSRVDNIATWVARLRGFAPVTSLSMELAKFDTQKMRNPEIRGVEYQQGTLQGYTVKEYLLEKFGRTCVYCGAKGYGSDSTVLEVEHVIPETRDGSDRLDNLVIACESCNREKDDRTAEEFGYPEIQAQVEESLRDAAVINATRWHVYHVLEATGLPLEVGTTARTKYNRHVQEYPKTHWIDAACVGESGSDVSLHPEMQHLIIEAKGRGSRQVCLMDRYGFPRTRPKRYKEVHGFRTGDLVRAVVPDHLKTAGIHVGRVAVRASGSFRVGDVDGINWKYCKLLQRNDGYEYLRGGRRNSSQG